MNKRILAVFGLVVFGGFVYWLSGVSFIVTEAPGQGSNYTAEITNSAGDRKTYEASGKKRMLLKKGAYEVVIQADNKSYFEKISTPGFLRSTVVSGELKSQSSYKFVGDNQQDCMNYMAGSLVSYQCGGYLDTALLHTPSNQNSPASAVNTNGTKQGYIIEETTSDTKNGYFIVLKTGNSEGSGDVPISKPGYYAYTVNNKLEVKESYLISSLDPDTSYVFRDSGSEGGFLAVNTSFDKVLYYSSPKSKPIEFKGARTANNGQVLDLSKDGERLATLVSYPGEDNKASSEVFISTTEKVWNKKLDKEYDKVTFCGNETVCLLSGSTLDVYSVKDQSLGLVNTLGDIDSFVYTDAGLVFVKSSKTYLVDPLTLKGSISVSFDGFAFHTLKGLGSDKYLLGIVGKSGRGTTLLVSANASANTLILDKVGKLQLLDQIKYVSVGDDVIRVFQELGELQYIESLGIYGYDPALVNQTNQLINEKIKELGIDQSKYKVLLVNR